MPSDTAPAPVMQIERVPPPPWAPILCQWQNGATGNLCITATAVILQKGWSLVFLLIIIKNFFACSASGCKLGQAWVEARRTPPSFAQGVHLRARGLGRVPMWGKKEDKGGSVEDVRGPPLDPTLPTFFRV